MVGVGVVCEEQLGAADGASCGSGTQQRLRARQGEASDVGKRQGTGGM